MMRLLIGFGAIDACGEEAGELQANVSLANADKCIVEWELSWVRRPG